MKKNFVLRSLLAIMLLFAGLNTAWAEVIESNFTSNKLAVGANELSWSTDVSATSFESTNYNRGVQWGTAKGEINLTATIENATITQVDITASTNGSGNTMAVSVGGVSYGSKSITSGTSAANTEYTFSGSGTGTIKVTLNDKAKSIYIKKIVVTYTPTTGGGDTPEPVDVAEPTFTPVDGTTFDESLDVTINVEDGLTAYYSYVEDGEYTSGNTVNITETTTVYAYAQDTEGNKSDVVSATYTKTEPLPEGAIAGAVVFKASGATYSGSISTVVDITGTNEQEIVGIEYASADVSLKHLGDGASSKTKYYTNLIRWYADNQMVFTPSEGVTITKVTIYASSSSYASVEVIPSTGTVKSSQDNNTIVWTGNTTEALTLTADAQVRYSYVEVEYTKVVSTDPEEVAVPTFDPVSGTAVKKGTVVTITSAEGTTLWYTVNGGADNETDTNTATITINEETTIEAAAVKGENMSDVVTATYTIAQLPVPTFNPAPGAVVSGTVVTISTVEGAEMAYSVNGEVLVAETSATVTINEDTEIEVFASMDGYIDSERVTVNYTIKELVAPGSTIADVLTADKFAATSTKYTDFSNVSVTSDAVYAGNNSMATDKDNAIQLRSTDHAGIVTTVSGGKVKKVTVTWNSNTNAERVMDVYGKNTPYISAADLYDNETKGALIASIACGTTELVIEGDYEYIGLRSKSGAMYLDEIQIEWYKPYPENIVCEQNYYLDVEGSGWTIAEGNSLAACFVNKNTDATTWSVGEYLAANKHYVFYLSQYNVPAAAPARAKAEETPVYTHVKFVNFEGATDALTPWVDGTPVNETAELTYTPAVGYEYTIYSVAGGGAWVGKNDISTGLEAVESDGMVYAGNVVAAEGAIEVYNLSGAVVARGNNRVDLNGLAGGVYVVRCGNDVLKVVR